MVEEIYWPHSFSCDALLTSPGWRTFGETSWWISPLTTTRWVSSRGIRNTLVITLTNLLKQDLTFSSNIFYEPFNADFAAVNASLSSRSNSSSCSGCNGSDGDSTSSCGSSKILTWTGKYKSGAIAGATVGEYNLGTSAGKWIFFGQGR